MGDRCAKKGKIDQATLDLEAGLKIHNHSFVILLYAAVLRGIAQLRSF
jgi:hypothetical protein